MKKAQFIAGLAAAISYSLLFDASQQYAAVAETTIGAFNVSNNFSISARVKLLPGSSDYQFICGLVPSDGSGTFYSLFVQNGVFAFDSYADNTDNGLIYQPFPDPVAFGVWVVVRVVREDDPVTGPRLRGYLNNVLQFDRPATWAVVPRSGTHQFFVGSARATQYFFNGAVDWVRVRVAGVKILEFDFDRLPLAENVTGASITLANVTIPGATPPARILTT